VSNLLQFRRVLARVIPQPARPDKPWPTLPGAIDPAETRTIMRAQSILSGPLIGACPPLTIEQARDVLRWAGEACESSTR